MVEVFTRRNTSPVSFDRRLGYTPDFDADCCTHPRKQSYRDLRQRIEAIRDKVAGRSVYVGQWEEVQSVYYFLGDLNVAAVSMPEQAMTIWVRDDLRELEAELRSRLPECAAAQGVSGQTSLLLQAYGAYTTEAAPGGFVYCKKR
jgi:hypothetical protein